MVIEPITKETRTEATAKWREYKNAEKVAGRKNKSLSLMYSDMKKIYWQIKTGKKVIDINQVIAAGGVHKTENQRRLPKLAIAPANQKMVYCTVWPDGSCQFRSDAGMKSYVNAKGLPTFKWTDGVTWRTISGEAPVPLIPPQYMPTKLTDDYYILWEVDEWKKVAPTDPYLLRRITKNTFIVLEGWDLTDVEKAVMNQYL